MVGCWAGLELKEGIAGNSPKTETGLHLDRDLREIKDVSCRAMCWSEGGRRARAWLLGGRGGVEMKWVFAFHLRLSYAFV